MSQRIKQTELNENENVGVGHNPTLQVSRTDFRRLQGGWKGTPGKQDPSPVIRRNTSSDVVLNTHTLDTGWKGVTGRPDEVLAPETKKTRTKHEPDSTTMDQHSFTGCDK